MSQYSRVTTPRAYMDRLSFNLANGWRTISNYTLLQDDGSTAVSFVSGQKEDLFDMRPSNYATIEKENEKFYLQIDTGQSSDTIAEANFLAILGHNLNYATGMFRVVHDDSSTMASANSVTASTAVTGLINATQSTVTVDSTANMAETLDNSETDLTVTDGSLFVNHIGGIIRVVNDESGSSEKMLLKSRSGNVLTVARGVYGSTAIAHNEGDEDIYFDYSDCIQPANNGWTLITWANNNSDNQYYRIEFIDNGGATSDFAQDVQLGSILLGEYISWPHSPDLNLGFNVDYDGTDLITSTGGSTFANTSYLGSPTWAKTNPWVLATAASENQNSTESRHYGRRKWNMDFSYIADTSLFLQDMHGSAGMIDGSDLYSQFYHKSLGSHQPFLFTIDKDSTDGGDYGLYRLANGGLQSTQQAFRSWNTKLNLIEHW